MIFRFLFLTFFLLHCHIHFTFTLFIHCLTRFCMNPKFELGWTKLIFVNFQRIVQCYLVASLWLFSSIMWSFCWFWKNYQIQVIEMGIKLCYKHYHATDVILIYSKTIDLVHVIRDQLYYYFTVKYKISIFMNNN